MRTVKRVRAVMLVLLCAGIIAGCAVPASWVHRPNAAPSDAEVADADRCEADARLTARPWRALPSVVGWLALDLAILAAEIVGVPAAREAAIGLGAVALVLLVVEAERVGDPAARQPDAEGIAPAWNAGALVSGRRSGWVMDPSGCCRRQVGQVQCFPHKMHPGRPGEQAEGSGGRGAEPGGVGPDANPAEV
jgi:hypothetical protein